MSTSIFSPEQLDKLVNETLSETGVTSTNAVVGTVDKDGMQLTAAFSWEQSRATWKLEGVVRHNWTGDNEVGAKLLLEW